MRDQNETRLLVAHSLTRKIGENFEKVIFQAEASLPSGFSLEEGFRDLHGTVLKAVQEATQIPIPVKSDSKEQSAFSRQGGGNFDEGEFPGEPVETIAAQDGTQLAQIFRHELALTFRVSDKLGLRHDAAPVRSFLVPRVLDAMWNRKHIDSYEIQHSQHGYLIGILVELVDGERDSERTKIKELTNAIAWTLRRLYDGRDPNEERS